MENLLKAHLVSSCLFLLCLPDAERLLLLLTTDATSESAAQTDLGAVSGEVVVAAQA